MGIDVEHVEQTADGLQEERLAAAAVALVLALGQLRVLTDGCPGLRLRLVAEEQVADAGQLAGEALVLFELFLFREFQSALVGLAPVQA